MKYYDLKAYGKTKVRPVVTRYSSNDTLAISLVSKSGEPFCTLTVNIMESNLWADDKTAFVDTNNCEWAEEFISENGFGEFTGYYGASGFCKYPLYRFNIDKLLGKED